MTDTNMGARLLITQEEMRYIAKKLTDLGFSRKCFHRVWEFVDSCISKYNHVTIPDDQSRVDYWLQHFDFTRIDL